MAEDVNLQPSLVVIFGITGDLSQRYLVPSLYRLAKQGLLHSQSRVVGVTRGDTTVDQLFEKVESFIEADENFDAEAVQALKQQTTMFRMDLDNAEDYKSLLQKLNQLEDEQGVCLNRLFYLSIPPNAYQPVIKLLGQNGLGEGCQHHEAESRLLVEKPFGFDLASAEDLINVTNSVFKEDQVFRIDHYMAKETVQNLMTFRYRNFVFESAWNNQQIESIEICAREKIGIAGRAVFYEPLGALRDFIQSHLLQILGILTMDVPPKLDSPEIHANKQASLDQVIPVTDVEKNARRGQYKGYRDEVNNQASNTETYASITVEIDNDRWRGVPIKLVTGKALNERKAEIRVKFRGKPGRDSNQIVFRIQPNEGIDFDLIVKRPGYVYESGVVPMNFLYQDDFGDHSMPEAYQRVLVDAMRGDHTLFATSQEILASWRVVQPVLDAWANNNNGLIFYDQGSRDPEAIQ